MATDPDHVQQSAVSSRFGSAEDEMLILAVRLLGPCNWAAIAALVPGRSGRQCRDRYQNYLRPGYARVEWTGAEDE
jgi:hypothetical protein